MWRSIGLHTRRAPAHGSRSGCEAAPGPASDARVVDRADSRATGCRAILLASGACHRPVLFGSRCYAILNSVGCTADKSSTRSTEARTEPRMPTAGAGRSPGRLSFGHHRLGFHGGRDASNSISDRRGQTGFAVHLDTEPEEVVGFAERKRSANRTILALTPSRCHLVRWMLESPCAVVPSAGMKVRSGPLQGAVTA